MIAAPMGAVTAKVRQLREQYEQDGWEVVEQPGPGQFPLDVSHFGLDSPPAMLARRGEESYVFQVRPPRGRPVDRLIQWMDEIESHEGWHVVLVSLDDVVPHDAPGLQGDPPPWEELETCARDALRPGRMLASPVRLLALWHALEGVLRRIAVEHAIPVDLLSAAALVAVLRERGLLRRETAGLLDSSLGVHHRWSHGYEVGAEAERAVRDAADALCQLLSAPREACDQLGSAEAAAEVEAADFVAQTVRQVRAAYEARGYEVVERPAPDEIPFETGYFGFYRPALLARRGGENLVIEVRDIGTSSLAKLVQRSDQIRNHPGWRFVLVTNEDVEPHDAPGPPPWERLETRADEALRVARDGASPLALQALWSALEGVMRRVAVDNALPIDRVSGVALFIGLHDTGLIPARAYEVLKDAYEVHRRVSHGYEAPADEVARAVAAVTDVLRQLLPQPARHAA